jgi:hypothetical protein
MLTLADYVRSQAQWRGAKAEQYPDDERNVRSADSLRALAEAVEQMRPQQEELIRSIEGLIREQRWGTPGRGVEQAVSRYGFDGEPLEPAAFLAGLLDTAREDAERARAFDHMLPLIVSEASATAEFCERNTTRVGIDQALRARAAAERLARRSGLQVELEHVRVLAELTVRDPRGDGSSTVACVEVDLSEHFELDDEVRELLGEAALEPASELVT